MKPDISLAGASRALVVLVACLPVFTSAQAAVPESPARLFISAGGTVDNDQTFSDSTAAIVKLVSIGVDLGRHVGLRLTLDLPTLDDTYRFLLSGDGCHGQHFSTGTAN